MKTIFSGLIYNEDRHQIIFNFLSDDSSEQFTSKKGETWIRHGYSLVTSYNASRDPVKVLSLMQDCLQIKPLSYVDVDCDMRGNIVSICPVE